MSEITRYLERLAADRAVHLAALEDIDLKIRVAREIEVDIRRAAPRHSTNGAVLEAAQLELSTIDAPLAGLQPSNAIKRYLQLNPGLTEIHPYQLYKKLEELGFSNESKNIRQIVGTRFTKWATSNGWHKYDKGVWRRKSNESNTPLSKATIAWVGEVVAKAARTV